jgi:glycosyltransferase involved in cell wall biosynthesis
MNISFCITSYSRDIHLFDRLTGPLLNQSEMPYEIILFCSEVADNSISSKIPDIKIITRPNRVMQSVARNICSEISSGDVLIFFDVDDIPHLQKIEITNFIFNEHNPDFFLHSYSNSLSNNYINKKSLDLRTDLVIDNNSTNLHCAGFPIHHAHIAVKRDVFKKVRFNESPEAYRREDGIFCQHLVRNNFKGIFSPEKLIQYNQ